MHPLAHAIRISWNRNGTYAVRLVADLVGDQWLAQPVSGRIMNHPAWIFSHLNLYAPIAAALAEGRPFEDPADRPFGRGSVVSARAEEYLPPAELLAQFQDLHAAAETSLERATEVILTSSNPLARWADQHPFVGDMLVTLMVKHESGHLGQLSAWRRALGLPPVTM